MKITLKQMKQAVADKAKTEVVNIVGEFSDPDDELKSIVSNKATDPNQWESHGPSNIVRFEAWGVPVGSIEHCFDCTPFDDQLRAYVYTDPGKTQIIRITIQGE